MPGYRAEALRALVIDTAIVLGIIMLVVTAVRLWDRVIGAEPTITLTNERTGP